MRVGVAVAFVVVACGPGRSDDRTTAAPEPKAVLVPAVSQRKTAELSPLTPDQLPPEILASPEYQKWQAALELGSKAMKAQRQTQLALAEEMTSGFKVRGLDIHVAVVGFTLTFTSTDCDRNMLVSVRDGFVRLHHDLGSLFSDMRCEGGVRLWLEGAKARAAQSEAKANIDSTTTRLRSYAFKAYPLWSAAHPDKACPENLDELKAYIDSKDTIDRWRRPLKMICGAVLPPGAKGIAVMSLGEDGKEGTADDLKSWE